MSSSRFAAGVPRSCGWRSRTTATSCSSCGRAVGAGVGAVGAELDPPAGVVDGRRVARAEAREPLPRRARPLDAEPQRRAIRAQLEHDVAVVREREPQDGRPPAAQRELDVQLVLTRVRDLGVDRALGEAELLARDQPLLSLIHI